MKTIKILLIIITISHFEANAQQKVSSNLKEYDISNRNKSLSDYSNTHITDKTADKYIGTWKWKQGANQFTLKLEKGQKNVGSKEKPWLVDIIKGGFQNIKDGKEVSNNLLTETLLGGSEGNMNKLFIYYSDPQQNKLLIFEVILNKDNTITWTLSKRRQEWQAQASNLSIPVDIKLAKVD